MVRERARGRICAGSGEELVRRLAEWGARGVGQSSWGPAVYGIVDGEEAGHRLASEHAPDWPDRELFTPAISHGRRSGVGSLGLKSTIDNSKFTEEGTPPCKFRIVNCILV